MINYNQQQQDTLNAAFEILEASATSNSVLDNPNIAKDMARVRLGTEEREHFGVLFLTAQHELISFEILFSGTIDGASVYPREVAKRALQLNAAAVIYTHNHPSGSTNPSEADKTITRRLVDSLNLLDVRSLDHIIVAGSSTFSFAERGLI